MNKLVCNLDNPYFTYLLEGKKTIIAHVWKGKWSNVFVGDTILIHNGFNGTQIEFEVENLITVSTFEELYQLCGSNLLPDLPETAWRVYTRYFSKEDESAYGVLGIQVKRKCY